MKLEHRLQVIDDATYKLLMVNPRIIVAYAYKVVGNPDAYPETTVQKAQAVVDEDKALAVHSEMPVLPIPEGKPLVAMRAPRTKRQSTKQVELQVV